MASAEKYLGIPLSITMVHAISWSKQFLLLAKPFCWRVKEVEQLRSRPLLSQNSEKLWFSNSPPWFVLIMVMLYPFSFWTFPCKFHKWLNASCLWARNVAHVNLEQSSTITRQYLLPFRIMVLICPNKLICNSYKYRLVVIIFIDLNELLTFFFPQGVCIVRVWFLIFDLG